MAKLLTKNSFTPGSAPSGLSAGELAVNVADKKIFVGNAVGGVVTLHDQQNVVTSVNGATGAIAGLTASQILVGSSNVNGTRYLTFVGGSGNTSIFIDDVTTPLTYNPLQGNIGAKKVVLTTSANVITIDSATPNFVMTDGTNISTFGVDSFSASYILPFVISNTVGLTFQSNSISFETGTGKYVFPTTNGSNGQVLTTNGSGTLSWGNNVSTINGSTGAITNVARTNEGNTFSVRQVMNAGITSQNIFITSGATFSNSTISIQNDNAKIDGTNSKLTLIGTASGLAPVSSQIVLTGADTDVGATPTILLSTNSAIFGGGIINIDAGTSVGITGNTTNRGTFTSTGLGTFNSGISASIGITSDSYRLTSSGINSQVASYSLVAGDNGKVVTMNSSSGITLTVPSGLPVGYSATVIRLGTGNVGISAAAGVTLNSFESKLNIAGQHAAVGILSYSSNIFNVSGGLTA